MPVKFAAFKRSIGGAGPPAGLSAALQALWWEAKGDWDKAHELAQTGEGKAGDRVHAYLHRKEGDQSNAAYWYKRAGQPVSTLTHPGEWEALARAMLEDAGH